MTMLQNEFISAVTHAGAPDHTTWAAAKARWDAAVAAERSDDDDVFDKMEQEQCDACFALLAVPAPNVGAAADKLEALIHQMDGFALDHDSVQPIVADLRRFAAPIVLPDHDTLVAALVAAAGREGRT